MLKLTYRYSKFGLSNSCASEFKENVCKFARDEGGDWTKESTDTFYAFHGVD